MPKPVEPCNLREWRVTSGRLFTCGRPGRGHYPSSDSKWPALVPDRILNAWLDGLPSAAVHVVSLLGTKFHGGHSEFKHYPFRSCFEENPKPSFQEWLADRRGQRFVVHEFPTIDADPAGIPADRLDAAASCIRSLLAKEHAVIVVDSAGFSRTGRVCREIGVPGFSSLR